jgi:hypothetical protein
MIFDRLFNWIFSTTKLNDEGELETLTVKEWNDTWLVDGYESDDDAIKDDPEVLGEALDGD